MSSEDQEPDALDQKGNRYFRRKLIAREFVAKDLMRLTFALPQGVSLKSLGFDIGLGDFVRMKPFSEDHKRFVENPAGGRAYSPVIAPDVEGKFGFIIRSYGPEDGKVVGVSSLLKHIPIGSEMLVANHVEHVFWNERNRGYYCNERNIRAEDQGSYNLCMIAFGIGITEIAPVATSELLDPRIKQITILWANKCWSDAEWAYEGGTSTADDLVRQFFANQRKYGDRLQIKHILSREKRPEANFHGRINSDVLTQAFLTDTDGNHVTGFKENLKFLAVGTTAMIDYAYDQLAKLGLDVQKNENGWGGSHLLYRKLEQSYASTDRLPSPLLAGGIAEVHKRRLDAAVDDSARDAKRPRM